jgi:lysozyme
MKISPAGLELIKEFEGFNTQAYPDQVSVWTIGYGTTHYPDGTAVKQGDVRTAEQCEEYLRHDVSGSEDRVNKYVTANLTQNEFDALVSFEYNTGALYGSTLLHHLNAGAYALAALEFPKWDHGKINGVFTEIAGLKIRRMKEQVLFLKPDTESATVTDPVPAVTGAPAPAPASYQIDPAYLAALKAALADTGAQAKLSGFLAGYKTNIVAGATAIGGIAGGIVAFANHQIDLNGLITALLAGFLALGQLALRHAVKTSAEATQSVISSK